MRKILIAGWLLLPCVAGAQTFTHAPTGNGALDTAMAACDANAVASPIPRGVGFGESWPPAWSGCPQVLGAWTQAQSVTTLTPAQQTQQAAVAAFLATQK